MDMLFSKHATNRGIYTAAVYFCHVWTRKTTQTRIYNVYISQSESTCEGRVPIYVRTVTGRRDTLTGREGSPSQAATQLEQEREEDLVKWEGVWRMGSCRSFKVSFVGITICMGWFGTQQCSIHKPSYNTHPVRLIQVAKWSFRPGLVNDLK